MYDHFKSPTTLREGLYSLWGLQVGKEDGFVRGHWSETLYRPYKRHEFKIKEDQFRKMVEAMASCIARGKSLDYYPSTAPRPALVLKMAKHFGCWGLAGLQSSYDMLRLFMRALGISEPFWVDEVLIPISKTPEGYEMRMGNISAMLTSGQLQEIRKAITAIHENGVKETKFINGVLVYSTDYTTVEFCTHRVWLLPRHAYAVCEHIRQLLESENPYV